MVDIARPKFAPGRVLATPTALQRDHRRWAVPAAIHQSAYVWRLGCVVPHGSHAQR